MKQTHLRRTALKKPVRPEDEAYLDLVVRSWTLCQSGSDTYRVATRVHEHVTCKNCLRMMEVAA